MSTDPAEPDPAAQPVAQFTVTVQAVGVEVTDHADLSRHHFRSLLGAVDYMELVSEARQHVKRRGGLL